MQLDMLPEAPLRSLVRFRAHGAFAQRYSASWRERLRATVFACGFVLAGLSASAQTVPADKPSAFPQWWFEREVIGLREDATAPYTYVEDFLQPSDEAPLLHGQLLRIADGAIEELDEELAPIGGAGFGIGDLRDSAKQPDFHGPAAIGQLKYVGARFYDRFAEIGFAAGSSGWPGSLVLDSGAGDNAPLYPWLNDVTSENLGIAAIGQAKHLFSWDIRAWVALDSENAESGDGLPDYWERFWFGDLSATTTADVDDDDLSNQQELTQATDPTSAMDADGNGIPDDWESFWDDQFAVFPKPIEAELTHGQSATKTLYLNNPVAPDVDFTVTVTGNEAAFQGPYVAEDSIAGSAPYSWTEISATGTLLPIVSEIDNDSEKITLTQFGFPHYGRKYTDIWVASDGYLSLKEEYNDFSNETLPDTSFPDGLIAAFWDDLDTDDGNSNDSGTIYYQEFSDRLIVQYEGVTQDANALTNTFQIVLYADGVIDFFYKELNGVLDSVTIGIHNFDQTQAVQIAHNAPYLQDLLAVRFTQNPAYFVEVSPLSGTATQGGFSSLAVDFETFELEPGTYQADIEIAHTGTGSTPWNIPAILELTNPPSQIELTAPDDGFTMWGDESVTLRATATDDDFGIDRVEFFADENKQGEDLTGPYYSHNWQPPTPDIYSLTARAVDQFGTVTISDPIAVTVLEDTDLDRMEDGWEAANFLGLQEGPLDDFDQDGASNLHEYEAGTDPTDDTDAPVNIPSVIAFTDPADGATYLEGDDISFDASFSDADFGAEHMVFYADGVEFDIDNSVYSSASGYWNNPAPGAYTVTAIATDRYGASSTVGTPITVTVLADSDGDRMPDAWETSAFGDLSQEASEDGDGDGFPNIIEYHHGSDGNDPASAPQFAAAQSAASPLTDVGEVRYCRVDGVSNTSFEKSTIQAAINAADDFDIIEVLPGVYDESINLHDRIYYGVA